MAVNPRRSSARPPGSSAPLANFDSVAREVSESPTAKKPGPAPMPIVPGYEILGELGRGGMGVVLHARDQRLGREVALKMVLGGGLADSRGRASLRAEAEALAALGHPGIVRVFDVGEAAGVPYVALEYCPGGTLASQLAGKPQPPRRAAAMIEEIALAMGAAHTVGIIHRDLKPANILLDAQGRLRLTDFGLAKRTDSAGLTRTGEAKGTLAYMAPEQAEGSKTIGPAADVYSLGAMLYEMLSGRPPFLAENETHQLYQLISQDPVGLRELVSRVPRDLETICHKCLAKEPSRRYANATELAADLRRYLDHRPIQARPAGLAERAVKWVVRQPALAGLIAVVVVGTVGLAITLAVAAARIAEQRDTAEHQRQIAEDARRAAEEAGAMAEAQRQQTQTALSQAERAYRQAERAVADQQRLLYASDMTLAWQAYENTMVKRASEILQRYRPSPQAKTDHRGFEWYALERALQPQVACLSAPAQQYPLTTAIARDGRTVAVCGYQGGVRLWDIGRQPPQLLGQRLPANREKTKGFWKGNAAAFSPDGRTLAVSIHEKVIRLWEVAHDGSPRELTGHTSEVCGLAFVDANTLVSVGADDTVRYWSLRDGRQLAKHKADFGGVYRAAFSGDCRCLAVGKRSRVSAWRLDPANPQTPPQAILQDKLPDETKKGYVNVLGVGLSADGKLLAVGLQNERAVRLYDLTKAEALPPLILADSSPADLALSPDGRTLGVVSGFSNNPGLVEFWNLATRQRTRVLVGHLDAMEGLTWSANSEVVVTSSRDQTARVWNTQRDPHGYTGPLSQVAPAASWVRHTNAGATLAAVTHEGLVLLNAGDLSVRAKVPAVLWDANCQLAVDSQGRRAAVGTPGKIVVYDSLPTGGQRAWEGVGPKVSCESLAFCPSGRWLAVVGEDPPEHLIRVYEVDTGREVARLSQELLSQRSKGSRPLTSQVAFSSDGQYLVATAGSFYSNHEHNLLIWKVQGDGFTFVGQGEDHPGYVRAMALGPDATLVTGCNDGNGRVWPPGADWTGPPALVLQGFADRVTHVAVSVDGRRVVMAGGSRVKIFDARDGRELGSLAHGGMITGLSFGADGLAVAVAAGMSRPSGGIRYWRAEQGVGVSLQHGRNSSAGSTD